MKLGGHSVSLAAFDLDGTIYFGDRRADGALELMAVLEECGVAVTFFTNNSGALREAVTEKLVRLGMPATVENTLTSGSATADYLVENGFACVSVIGTDALCSMIESAGVQVVRSVRDAEALVVGLVPDFDLGTCPPTLMEDLPEGCRIIACNMDNDYPIEGGARRPGCGAIVRVVERCTGRQVDAVVGKPATYMLHDLCQARDMSPEQVVVVGDSKESDIAMAVAAGSPSVLVGTDVLPGGSEATHVVRDLHELRELLLSHCHETA